MKKIANPTGDVRLTGQAESDGIAFRVFKFLDGEFGLYFAGTLATARNNDITCSPWDKDSYPSPVHAKIAKLAKITTFVTGILGLFFMVAYLVLAIITEKVYWICFDISYIMVSAMNLSVGLVIFIARIFGDKEIRSFSKFLAARNAVQNAYYDTGKVPDVEEAKKYSAFSYSSRYITSSSAFGGTMWLSLALIHHLPVPWHLLGLIIVIAAFFVLAKKDLLFFWQFLIVSKPEDIHYQVAITALRKCIASLDSFYVHVTSVTYEELIEDLGPDCDSPKELSESESDA